MYLHLHEIRHIKTKLVCVNSNIDTTLVYTYFILTNKKPKTQMPTHASNQGY
jgi:hypothetical protein